MKTNLEDLKKFTKDELIMRVEKLENSNARLTSEVQELSIETIHKRLHEINTFQCVDNELYLRGKDEMGADLTICFDAFNFLEWIDTEHLKYIKKELIKYIKTK
jgi:hypothetical protein